MRELLQKREVLVDFLDPLSDAARRKPKARVTSADSIRLKVELSNALWMTKQSRGVENSFLSPKAVAEGG